MIGKTVVVTARHDWGAEGTKARLIERFTVLRNNFRNFIGAPEARWSGNYCRVTLGMLGLTVTAFCEIGESELKVLIQLPFLLSGLAGPVESFLKSHGDLLTAAPGLDAAKPMMMPLAYHHELLWVHRRLLGLASRRRPAPAASAA